MIVDDQHRGTHGGDRPRQPNPSASGPASILGAATSWHSRWAVGTRGRQRAWSAWSADVAGVLSRESWHGARLRGRRAHGARRVGANAGGTSADRFEEPPGASAAAEPAAPYPTGLTASGVGGGVVYGLALAAGPERARRAWRLICARIGQTPMATGLCAVDPSVEPCSSARANGQLVRSRLWHCGPPDWRWRRVRPTRARGSSCETLVKRIAVRASRQAWHMGYACAQRPRRRDAAAALMIRARPDP
jgi:hypothetical protein